MLSWLVRLLKRFPGNNVFFFRHALQTSPQLRNGPLWDVVPGLGRRGKVHRCGHLGSGNTQGCGAVQPPSHLVSWTSRAALQDQTLSSQACLGGAGWREQRERAGPGPPFVSWTLRGPRCRVDTCRLIARAASHITSVEGGRPAACTVVWKQGEVGADPGQGSGAAGRLELLGSGTRPSWFGG